MTDSRYVRWAMAALVTGLAAACGADEPTDPGDGTTPPLVVDVSGGLVTTDADSFLAALRALETDSVEIEQVLIVLRQQVNPLSPTRMRELGPAVLLLPVAARDGNTRGGIETGTSSAWDPAIQNSLGSIVEEHGGTVDYIYETLPALKAALPPDSASRRNLFVDLALHPNLDWLEPASPGYFDPPSNPVPLGGVRAVLDPGDPIGSTYPVNATIPYTLFFDTRDTVYAEVCDFGENGHWTAFLERMEGVWADYGHYGCSFDSPKRLVFPPGSQFRDSVRLNKAPPPEGLYRLYWGFNYDNHEWVVWDSVLSHPFNLR